MSTSLAFESVRSESGPRLEHGHTACRRFLHDRLLATGYARSPAAGASARSFRYVGDLSTSAPHAHRLPACVALAALSLCIWAVPASAPAMTTPVTATGEDAGAASARADAPGAATARLRGAPARRRRSRPIKAIWGPLRLRDGRSAFPLYRQLGVDVLQLQLPWNEVAPTEPTWPGDPTDPAYDWPVALGHAIRAARRRGIEIALLVRGSPPWANGGRGPDWAPEPRHWARFLTAASRRYRAVRRWMIWGEPNRAVLFQPLPANDPTGPRAYARLLDAAYRALKRRSRRNVVIGGMTASHGDVQPAAWLRWMRLPGGRRPRLDEYGHNPFSVSRTRPELGKGLYRNYPDIRDIDLLDVFAREIRRAYRGHRRHRRSGGPPIWISEFTVSSNRPNRAFDYAVSRRGQARWMRSAYRIARHVGASGFGWFNLQDEPPMGGRGLTMGLLTNKGRRKPAYRAFKRLP